MAGSEPLKVRLCDERHAAELAHELTGIEEISVHRNGCGWEVVVDCAMTDRIISRVLDSLRRTLAGGPAGAAFVSIDGREYEFDAD